ncbi:cell division protein FtsX [Pseudoflavonifractor capillosus ATCC 29799]|uniref:Cell division protein FtsX n=1 Tax=Pseudoflavonifractor capillosus ATCC 29799 TaxID=411467 RepID=A6NZ14_9FIRM|nr:permease-like cell division protein FtsX [Pseudoflavonifractor capillosus]EDM98663.1 cell division protein FtsX [Pseudoflavonifractor capillosus ATCC 29799]
MRQRFNFSYFLSEGFHSIFTHGLMSFAAVCMIVACLLIMGSFSLVAVNVGSMLGELERDNEFLAYVDENLSEEDVAALKGTLEAVPNVASVEFISKETAKEDYVEQYASGEDAELFLELPDEVFRDRYSIKVTDIEQFSQTVAAVGEVSGVVNIQAIPEIAQGFVVISNVASGVAIILVVMLVVMSLFIIANTIKLGTFTRRDEIAIMKMCGATNSFVRWPFVVEGMILGLVGAVVAFLLQWGVYSLIGQAIATSDTIQLITIIPFETMALKVFGIFCSTGLVVGVGGSMVAIGKFLQV